MAAELATNQRSTRRRGVGMLLAVSGLVVIAAGVVLVFTPGPGIALLPLGVVVAVVGLVLRATAR